VRRSAPHQSRQRHLRRGFAGIRTASSAHSYGLTPPTIVAVRRGSSPPSRFSSSARRNAANFGVMAILMVAFALALWGLPDDAASHHPDRRAWHAWADMAREAREWWVWVPTVIAIVGGLPFRATFSIQPELIKGRVAEASSAADLGLFDVARDVFGQPHWSTADLWFLLFQLTNVVAAVSCMV
jgi:hypothetical protein